MKKIFYLLPVLLFILACTAQPQINKDVNDMVNATLTALAPAQTPVMPTAIPFSNTLIPAAETSSWSNYNNAAYGYSLNYPDFYNVVTVSDEYVEIGDKIVISIWNTDPTAPLGDGSLIESTTDTQISGYSAKLLTGYIGSIGGYIPQQFKRFVVERNDSYFVITLYALGLHVTEGDVSQIAQLNYEDISLFENMVSSIQIH